MSDDVESTVQGIDAAAVGADALTAGQQLRRAREAAGLHIAVLAVSMKVPVKKLEALEADQWGELLDAVFARALAASMCRTLKIDSAPVLKKMPLGNAPRLLDDRSGINETFDQGAADSLFSRYHRLATPRVLMVLGLLLAASLVILVPENRIGSLKVKDGASNPAALASAVESASSPPQTLREGVPVAAENAPQGTPEDVRSAPVPAAEQRLASGAEASPALSAAATVLVFKAKGAAWVGVLDAKGVTLLHRTLAPGETAAVGGTVPLSVVVGRADLVDILLRGKPFAMPPAGKDNVVRFEVQ